MDLTFHSFVVPTFRLPDALASLERLASNFYWSWHPEGVTLFRSIAPAVWEDREQNPRRLLEEVSELRLCQLAADDRYVKALNEFTRGFDEYLAQQPDGRKPGPTEANPVAYFCAEYGIHNSLPIYSGGLGILAGDHLKSASDLNIPLVAVGLLYRYGYFRQKIAHDGWQEEHYSNIFLQDLAVEPVVDANGERITVSVRIRDREVVAQTWLVNVGRVKLYLLDTNVPENTEIDRMITGHLYGGNTETRIVQEKLLGIGGVRLIRKLGIDPCVFHLNEGHSAFLTLELTHEQLAGMPDADFDTAADIVRKKCVFTTHTPVAAGNDRFDPAELLACFSAKYIEELKLTQDEFLGLGRVDPGSTDEPFGMTPLAIRMCRTANGVSEKHGEVSRGLWQPMFSENTEVNDVPITHVTNGVQPSTWIAAAYQSLFETHIGKNWVELTRKPEEWRTAAASLPDRAVWDIHCKLKSLLIAFVRDRTVRKDIGPQETINEHLATHQPLSPKALTIGFARRVALYKRWDLLFSDLTRLLRLVDDQERPVQFLFAGKAHPQDRTAKQILQRLMSINHESNWQRRAVFIEDYDQEVARYMVQGVDVWMNVPRRPLEASGTSGMKAAMNGVLNFSILDGWWIEGYNGQNGFAIGGLDVEKDEIMDAEDAVSFYSVLENSVIPAFYSFDAVGLPAKWIAMMKDSIATLTPQFSSDRMVKDYLENIYRQGEARSI